MDLGIVVGICAGLLAGIGITLLPATRRAVRRAPGLMRRGADQGGGALLGQRVIDHLSAGVVVLDDADVPILVNPAARSLALLRAGTEAGTVIAHPMIRTLAGQVRRTGVRRQVELELPRNHAGADAEPLGVQLRAAGLGGGYVVVEAIDATDAHRLARVRRDFVANVSHELKTPIGALQLLAEALLDATGIPAGGPGAVPAERAEEDLAAARRFAQRIQHESGRLGRLVEELLELTRLQGADSRAIYEPVAVDWVVAEVLDRTRTTAAAAKIGVLTSGQPGLKVYGDANQIATALGNLVGNAIKYSGAGTTVTVDVAGVDDYVKIAVTDQGSGIAPDDLPRVFERFYRTDQARSRATGGTGLGLAIVKHIAGNHGGRIEVASTLGGGTTFTLSLPARPPEELLAAVVPDWNELPGDTGAHPQRGEEAS